MNCTADLDGDFYDCRCPDCTELVADMKAAERELAAEAAEWDRQETNALEGHWEEKYA